jgi:hypothetical protein
MKKAPRSSPASPDLRQSQRFSPALLDQLAAGTHSRRGDSCEPSGPKEIEALPRRDDRDGAVRAKGEQMRAVTGHDALSASSDCRSDDVVVVNIIGHDSRHFARRHQDRRIAVGHDQLLDRCCGVSEPV